LRAVLRFDCYLERENRRRERERRTTVIRRFSFVFWRWANPLTKGMWFAFSERFGVCGHGKWAILILVCGGD